MRVVDLCGVRSVVLWVVLFVNMAPVRRIMHILHLGLMWNHGRFSVVGIEVASTTTRVLALEDRRLYWGPRHQGFTLLHLPWLRCPGSPEAANPCWF